MAKRLESLSPSDDGWHIVTMFYAALHLVDAYLSTKPDWLPPQSHSDRRSSLIQYPEMKRLGNSYRELQNVSEDVRYSADYVYETEMTREVKRDFHRVIAVIEPLLLKKLHRSPRPQQG
jgi:hypothetical protein